MPPREITHAANMGIDGGYWATAVRRDYYGVGITIAQAVGNIAEVTEGGVGGRGNLDESGRRGADPSPGYAKPTRADC